MDIFFTQSMFWGPFRIILFILFCYFVNRILVKNTSLKGGIDFFASYYSVIISFVVIITFLLTQINAFDIVFVFIILGVLALFTFLNLNLSKPIKPQLRVIRFRSLIYTIKTFEKGDWFISKKNVLKKKVSKKSNVNATKIKWQVRIALAIGLLSFISRYYFFNFDSYTLSENWYSELAAISDISKQNWFFHKGTMMGEFAVINFYSKIAGISSAIALTSFSILESSILSVLIFWFVNKITNANLIAGLVAALSFILLFVLLPLNINLITQPKSIFLGLTLILPYFIYAIDLFSKKKNTHIVILTLLTISIGFINLFLFLLIMPLIISCITLFHLHLIKESGFFRLIKSYLIAVIILFTIHFIASKVQNYSLTIFLKSSLYSFQNYTYSPQLIAPIQHLIIYYDAIACIFTSIAMYLWKIKKQNFKHTTIVLTFLSLLFTAAIVNFSFIDSDLLNQVLAVAIPLLFGLSLAVVLYFIKAMAKIQNLGIFWKISIVTTAIVLITIFLENGSLTNYPPKNPLNEEILGVYDRMDRDLLPFSYAVVNDIANFRIGENAHYFMNYSFFNESYLDLDANFSIYKTDRAYLKLHPEIVIPSSIFVFVYDASLTENKKDTSDFKKHLATKNTIEILRSRGKTVQLYYAKPLLKVYQIVNKPNASRINDLLL